MDEDSAPISEDHGMDLMNDVTDDDIESSGQVLAQATEFVDIINEHNEAISNIFQAFHDNMSLKMTNSRELMVEIAQLEHEINESKRLITEKCIQAEDIVSCLHCSIRSDDHSGAQL